MDYPDRFVSWKKYRTSFIYAGENHDTQTVKSQRLSITEREKFDIVIVIDIDIKIDIVENHSGGEHRTIWSINVFFVGK